MTAFMTKASKPFFIFIFFLLAGGMLSACLRYELQWDFHNYHYYNGFSFLNGRLGYDLAPGYQMTFNNPLLDVITYLTASAFNRKIIVYSFIMGLYFGGLLYILFQLNKLFFNIGTRKGKAALILSMALGVTGFATWFQIGSSTGEIPVSILVLSGLYILIRHWFVLKDISKKTFFLAGFLLGTGAALKLTAAMYCITSGITVLLFFKKLPRPAHSICWFVLGGLAGFLLFNGFWMIMLYKEYQNPFFPFFNAVFKSPYFPEINTRDTIHTLGNTWFTRLMLPLMTICHSKAFPIVGNASFTDFRFLVFFILLIELLCKRFFKHEPPLQDTTKFIIIFTIISYCFWIYLFSIIRYTIPIESMIGILVTKTLFDKREEKRFEINDIAFYLKDFIICFLLLSTPLISKEWSKFPSDNVWLFINPDNVELSENSLVFLVNPRTSSTFVPIARKNPKIRAISFYAPELLFWNTDGSITNYGKFKEKKEEIIKNHIGDILMIIKSDPTDSFPEKNVEIFADILKKAQCFYPEFSFTKDGKQNTIFTKDFRFCKISKNSDTLLNEE